MSIFPLCWWQEPHCAPQISPLTSDLLATALLRDPRIYKSIYYTIQMECNSRDRNNYQRGERTIRGMKTKWILSLILFNYLRSIWADVGWCNTLVVLVCSIHIVTSSQTTSGFLSLSKQKEFCVLSLSKYLDWRQSFCFSWHRVSCIEGYLTLLETRAGGSHLSHTVHNVILRDRGDLL